MARTILLGLFFYLFSQLPGQIPIQFYDFEDNANRSTTLMWNRTGVSVIDINTAEIFHNKTQGEQL